MGPQHPARAIKPPTQNQGHRDQGTKAQDGEEDLIAQGIDLIEEEHDVFGTAPLGQRISRRARRLSGSMSSMTSKGGQSASGSWRRAHHAGGDVGARGLASLAGCMEPFNISVDSLRLPNFTADEVATLLHQHTEETGQVFEPDAVAHIADLTRGQPWLVNALARRATQNLVPDPSQPIKELIIQERHTHIDSLVDKLREPLPGVATSLRPLRGT